jgi:hypothetical protein
MSPLYVPNNIKEYEAIAASNDAEGAESAASRYAATLGELAGKFATEQKRLMAAIARGNDEQEAA